MRKGFRSNHTQKLHIIAAFAFGGIETERALDPINPTPEESFGFHLRTRQKTEQLSVELMLLGIKAVIAEHVEMLLGDMDNETFYEIKGRNGFDDAFVVLVPLIPKRDERAVIVDDAGLRHGGPSDVSRDVIRDDMRRVEIGIGGVDIETVRMLSVKLVFQGTELIFSQDTFHVYKKRGLPTFSEHCEREIFNGTPYAKVAGTAFRDEHVNMRIPFQIPTESMQAAYDAGCEAFRFFQRGKPILCCLSCRFKKHIEQGTVSSEEYAQLFRNCEYDVSVFAIDKLCGYGIGAVLLISDAACVAES